MPEDPVSNDNRSILTRCQFGVTISTWWVYSLPWIWSNGGHEVNEAVTKATFNITPLTRAKPAGRWRLA